MFRDMTGALSRGYKWIYVEHDYMESEKLISTLTQV